MRHQVNVMNQPGTTTKNQAIAARPVLSSFSTPLGWMGLLGDDGILSSVFVGHSSAKSILDAAATYGGPVQIGDWIPSLKERFEAYAEGEITDFPDIEVRLPPMTEFRRQIVFATRKLGYGQTASYGELAGKIGHPGAARAVGTVMSTNRFPILIPCHRVLAAGGKLGGYTSPAGTSLKQKLLDMEARSSGLRPVIRRPG